MVEKSEMRKIPQEQKRKHFSKKNEHELKANQNRFFKFFFQFYLLSYGTIVTN